MTERQLRNLKRSQLLELLLALRRENEKLRTGQITTDKPHEDGKSTAQVFPESDEIRREIRRTKYKSNLLHVFRNTICIIVVAAAVAVLISALMCPVLRIYGHSMNDSLEEGDIVLALRGSNFTEADIVAFYYNNNLLVKRVIGNAGEWIDIDQEGNVSVNNRKLKEPYLKEKAYGEVNITLPYQVPDSRIFVMGDNRSVSIDSRNTAVGCISQEQIVGKVVFRIWPLSRFGAVR